MTTQTKIIDSFLFTKSNLEKLKKIISKYPKNRQQSAVIAALDIAQRQSGGWLPKVAMDEVAKQLNIPTIRVYEVATFYSMFNLKPVGKHFVQVCRTTPCWLRGSDDITKSCQKKLGINLGETTKDGKFTLVEVECLGACANAPMVQINDNYYEDLTPENMEILLDKLSKDEKTKTGSQTGRKGSEPVVAGNKGK